jgi:hypothetical protein
MRIRLRHRGQVTTWRAKGGLLSVAGDAHCLIALRHQQAKSSWWMLSSFHRMFAATESSQKAVIHAVRIMRNRLGIPSARDSGRTTWEIVGSFGQRVHRSSI